MNRFLITVKLPKNPLHNPHKKVKGYCPVDRTKECTDVTGEHHTVLYETNKTIEQAKEAYQKMYHVTRIEEA